MEGRTVGLWSVDERALLDIGVHEVGAEVLISLYALVRLGGGVVVLLKGIVRVWRACGWPVPRIGCALRALVLGVRRALTLGSSRSIGSA